MSFRVTTARVEAIIALAISNLHARPPEAAPIVYAEDSIERRFERAVKLANTHFADGHRKGITLIVAEILGLTAEQKAELIPPEGVVRPSPFVPGDAIVLLRNPNNHHYPLGEVVYVCGALEGLPPGVRGVYRRDDGELERGDVLPYHTRGVWRFATEAEIDASKAKMMDLTTVKGADALLALFK